MVANALSRRAHPGSQCLVITAVFLACFKKVQDSYEGDQNFSEILAALVVDSTSQQNYTIHQGALRYEGRICIGQNGDPRHKLVTMIHYSALGGHSGVSNTYQRL